ncbi:MAG: HAMP domain-containing protein [Planctomycetes bacterium]|nr:HAMP domain-containing protein [Planctomycetota bacterium]
MRDRWGREILLALAVALGVVALLFAGYEVVERIWLGGADSELLHALHLTRGLTAAFVATLVATVVLLRQTGRHRRDSELPPTRGPWKRRIQHVTLRTKIVVPMALLALVPVAAIGTLASYRTREALLARVVERVEFDTGSKARDVEAFLAAVEEDLRFLTEIRSVRELAGSVNGELSEHDEDLRRNVEREFLIFSQGKRAYYQVRYLDERGHEVVRLDLEDGLPRVVPAARLQDKGDRYYFKAALMRETGSIYVSPVDLNVEHGEIEVPHRAVVRYASRVLDWTNRPRGVLVINLFAESLFALLGPLSPGTRAWMLDETLATIGSVGESNGWTVGVDPEKRKELRDECDPDALDHLRPGGPGNRTVHTGDSILASASIAIDASDGRQRWLLVVAHPREPIESPVNRLTTSLSIATGLVAVAAGAIGVLISHYLARPIRLLRDATREIASGDLSRRVEIETGDEIEGLAKDFNEMTARLQEAQDRLSSWNLELQREVSRQTDRLRELQSGLARADKMASIGQIAAGVLHEVGNPLAAIKAKIQVSQEEDAVCENCKGILAEIMREVDRLAAFLRSFARVHRDRASRREMTSLPEVARDACLLLEKEISRRELSLQLDLAPDVPEIQGDPDQLRQVLINLVLNAADASAAGGKIRVSVSREADPPGLPRDPAAARIEVCDQGAGIPEGIRDRVWEPFYTTKEEGTGLGLAICRKVIEEHGGKIGCESRAGEGATFWVSLPGGKDL